MIDFGRTIRPKCYLCPGTSVTHLSGLYNYRPTLLANMTPASRAVREEIFGPVLTVQTFDDEEEALTLADHPT